MEKPPRDTGNVEEESAHQRIIIENRLYLVESIDVLDTYILDQLIQDHVLTVPQVAAIKEGNRTNNQRISALLDQLYTRTADDWKRFKQCLLQHGHDHVVQKIEEETRRIYGSDKEISNAPGSCVVGATALDPRILSEAPTAEMDLENLRLVGSWQREVADHYRKYNSFIHVCEFGPYRRRKKMESLYIPPVCSVLDTEDKTETDIGDIHSIFRNTGKPNTTFISGLPGSGKTTLVSWCLSTWADLVQTKIESATLGGGKCSDKPDFMYDLIICISLRNVERNASFLQTVKKQIWCSPSCYPDIEHFISESPSRVLIILDGLDEYSPEVSSEVTAIIKGELFPNVSKIVTSRHTKANSPSDELVQYYEKRVQINGFDDSRVLQYMYKYKGLPIKHTESLTSKGRANKKFVEELYQKIKRKHMLPVCQVPLHLCFICQLAEAGEEICATKTQLYLKMLKYQLDRNVSKTTSPTDFTLDNIEVYHNDLVRCGTGALDLLRGEHRRFTFHKETVTSDDRQNFIEKGNKLGLIIPVQPEHLGDTKLYTFSHLSVQEFLAGYAIAHDQTQRQLFISYLTNIFRLHNNRNVISFCCGMSEQCGNKLLSHAVELVRNSKDEPTADQCPCFNRKSWSSGKVDWEAKVNLSKNISYFLAQCVSEYKNQQGCDIPLPGSVTLDLSQPETQAMLAMLRHNKSQSVVQNVEIRNGDLSGDIWEAVISVILLHELELLYLDVVRIEDSAALAASICNMTNLKYMTLMITSLTETDAERILAAIPKPVQLVRLRLRHFRISPHAADLLSAITASCSCLVRLDLTDTDLSLLGSHVTSLITSEHLAQLEINKTNVTRKQIELLYATLPARCPRLLFLDMEHNDISGMEHLVAEAVSQLPHLSWLNLRNCKITSEGLWHLLQHLPDSLRVLDICFNGFTHFSQLLQCPHTLQPLRFLLCKGSAVPVELMQELVHVCKSNLPDLVLMYDDKSYNTGEQELNAFLVEHYTKLNDLMSGTKKC